MQPQHLLMRFACCKTFASFADALQTSLKDFKPQSERQRLFNGKQLVTSAKSAYQLTWPFVLWGILVMILYGVSYQKLGDVKDGIIAIKMGQRSLAEASRLTYYGARIALESVRVPQQSTYL